MYNWYPSLLCLRFLVPEKKATKEGAPFYLRVHFKSDNEKKSQQAAKPAALFKSTAASHAAK
jgi:hypothetical protein